MITQLGAESGWNLHYLCLFTRYTNDITGALNSQSTKKELTKLYTYWTWEKMSSVSLLMKSAPQPSTNNKTNVHPKLNWFQEHHDCPHTSMRCRITSCVQCSSVHVKSVGGNSSCLLIGNQAKLKTTISTCPRRSENNNVHHHFRSFPSSSLQSGYLKS